jgi:hypothetical protein
MIVATSMTLLAHSRPSEWGGLLPWSVLAVDSAAGLAANVAVSDPAVVGQVIAARPSLRPHRRLRVADTPGPPRGRRRAGSTGLCRTSPYDGSVVGTRLYALISPPDHIAGLPRWQRARTTAAGMAVGAG